MAAHMDAAIPGRGPSPTFIRSYNSSEMRSGPLGIGWTHNYNLRLTDKDGSGATVILHRKG